MARVDPSTALGLRIAATSVAVNAALAALNVGTGLRAGSASVVAVGVEFAGDVLAALVVWTGLRIAARPPDANHPYGHGRAEVVAGLVVGMMLCAVGVSIAVRSISGYDAAHPPPPTFALWPLVATLAVKLVMTWGKIRAGRRIGSSALVADGWNDAVDVLSTSAALCAVALTLYDPQRFLPADHFGAFAVGIVVISIGLRLTRDASLELMDTMPDARLLERVRAAACRDEQARGVEKCFARKTGLRYHVDLHLDVDPAMTVADSHAVAQRVRERVRREVPEVEDVLVHVEPAS